MNHSDIVNFIWNIANLIRDTFRRSKYPDVILPFTVLRRIDLVLAPTKTAVLTRYDQLNSQIAPDALDKQLQRTAGFAFYNTSPYDFDRLYQDQDHITDNLRTYINGFSPNMREVIEKFDFHNTINKLDEAGLLYLVLQEFRLINLHPDTVSNQQMGTIFEELLRKFNEAANENPGEHFTPPDVVALMVDLLMAGDEAFITQPHVGVTIYDPCCGTGGMLTKAKERLSQQNETARVFLFGQEVNPETYAICKADLYLKSEDGSDAQNIAYGSTLSNDQHSQQRFNYLLANPPYGKDWRMDKEAVETEAARPGSRFHPGLPRSNDGQMLFLLQMIARMHTKETGHSRMAIVMNGSPLFTGDAGSGESNIRRYILENDWLEAIIALPESLFYNTGIGTYIWLLSTQKSPQRIGKIQLIDATTLWVARRKSLGDKRRDVSAEQAAHIVRLYQDFAPTKQSQIFDTTTFGYRKVVVERPLRLNFQTTPERIARLWQQSSFNNLAKSRKRQPEVKAAEEAAGRQQQADIIALLEGLPTTLYKDRALFMQAVNEAAQAKGVKLTATLRKAIWQALGERDETAVICRDKKGQPEPDTDLRDTERVPLTETVTDFFEREVLPYVPDAWLKTDYVDEQDGQIGRVGYEINFNRYFYEYVPPRPLADIETDIEQVESRIIALLSQVTGRETNGL